MATDKIISAKAFLTKTNSKAAQSVAGFLDAYREFLTCGEAAYLTEPIMCSVDNGETSPSEALAQIRELVFAHVLEVERVAADESIASNIEASTKASKPSQKSTGASKKYQARIVDILTGLTIIEDGEYLVKGFDLPQEAERWVDRTLFAGAPTWEGKVLHTKAKFAEHATDTIKRDDSIARILCKRSGAIVKRNTPESGTLGFRMKVRNSTSHFSNG